MERIAVVGCGGSGKTRLANQVAAVLDLPVTHLDGIYYDVDWRELPQQKFGEEQRELVARADNRGDADTRHGASLLWRLQSGHAHGTPSARVRQIQPTWSGSTMTAR